MKSKSPIGLIIALGAIAGLAAGMFFFNAPAANGQFIPGYAEARMHRTFQVMKNNVGQIGAPASEKERWITNVAMWQAVLAHFDDPQNTNGKFLRESLQIMQANVDHVMQPGERERWDLNIALWRLMLARLDDPSILNVAQINAALGQMDANICCIAEEGEHERWQANHDMWQMMVARWTNQVIPLPA
jgi:hypothetical protein